MVSKKPKVFEADEEKSSNQNAKEPFKALPNFYKFTGRAVDEQKSNRTIITIYVLIITELSELRRKFEEDKIRLAELKKAKIFQPEV